MVSVVHNLYQTPWGLPVSPPHVWGFVMPIVWINLQPQHTTGISSKHVASSQGKHPEANWCSVLSVAKACKAITLHSMISSVLQTEEPVSH